MTLRQKISDIPLYLQILIGMITGIIIGLIALQVDGGDTFIRHWIQPWGQIFIRLLQLIAIPLVFISLIKGMTGLKDISKFSRIGGKTIGTYICTTVVAILIGLAMGLLVQPGKLVNHEQVAHLQEQFIRACYQTIAILFIAQVLGIDLSFSQLCIIVAMTVLSSIGTPGIPGGSYVILAMVLTSVGIPVEGLALILGVDRPLDMLRTAVNVTGDAAVCSIIDR